MLYFTFSVVKRQVVVDRIFIRTSFHSGSLPDTPWRRCKQRELEVLHAVDIVEYLVQMLMGNHLSQMGQLRVQIRRNHILEDALQQLTMHMEDLHKPLRVTFLSEDGQSKEEAVDEGGVSKVRCLPSVKCV